LISIQDQKSRKRTQRIQDHPYIRNKVKEDALVYAESLFLQKMTRRNFMTQLRQIDNGDNSARMHEVVNQTISQIRENSKFASTQRTDLEKFYKDFRNDVMEVMEKSIDKYSGSKKQKKDSEVINSAKLNDLINEALKKDKKDPI
jgi:flagellar hook-basal body complex protein FliE